MESCGSDMAFPSNFALNIGFADKDGKKITGDG
jgi:hypothetical protein